MAYKQTPGRGNQAKTGHGIPAPFKQTKPAPKEKSTWENVKETATNIGSKIKEGAKKLDKALEGKYMPTSEREGSDTVLGVSLSGRRAGTYDATKNPLSSEYKKSPARQMKPNAKAKAPAKMKKC